MSYSHEDRKTAEALHRRLDIEGWWEEGKLAHRAFWFNNPVTDEPVTRGHPKPDELSIEIANLAKATGLEFPAELVKTPLLRIN